MFPNGSTMLLPWSIHNDQHDPTALFPPELAQGTAVRDFMHGAPRFQAPESCPTPRSRTPPVAIRAAFDHSREPAAGSIDGYPYRDTSLPPPSTSTNPPQAVRRRHETMCVRQGYSRSGDSEMSSRPRSPVVHGPSPTMPHAMPPSSASIYSHSGYSKVPSGCSYPHFDAPPPPIPYGNGCRLPPIMTLGEYQASRRRQRPEPYPAPELRLPQLAMPPTFHFPGTRSISDYRYLPFPSSPPPFALPSPRRFRG